MATNLKDALSDLLAAAKAQSRNVIVFAEAFGGHAETLFRAEGVVLPSNTKVLTDCIMFDYEASGDNYTRIIPYSAIKGALLRK